MPSFALRVLRARIVQFAIVGGLVFAVSSSARATIHLSRADLDGRRDAELQKKPLLGVRGDVDGAVTERAIEDEILYREGLKLGFDRNDAIIRARVVQKTLFLAEELAGASEQPTDAELRQFYDESRARWRTPERWSIVHLFARDRDSLVAVRERANAQPNDLAALGSLGEPCQLPRSTTLTRDDAEKTLGTDFVNALATAPQANFSAPTRSSLGWHIVRVLGHDAPGQASFDEVKGSLRGIYANQRREAAVSTYLDHAFHAYDVEIDGTPVNAIHPAGRRAVRKASSAED